MGMAVVGEAGEGTVGEEGVSEVEVGLEAAGEEAMVVDGRLRWLVNLFFDIERGVERDMHALVSITRGIPHESNA